MNKISFDILMFSFYLYYFDIILFININGIQVTVCLYL